MLNQTNAKNYTTTSIVPIALLAFLKDIHSPNLSRLRKNQDAN